MELLFTNNAKSTLVEPITASSLVIKVGGGTGDKFPSPGNNQAFTLTASNSDGTIYEIMLVTSRTGDVMTVQRGQEGTAALPWAVGTIVELLITKRDLDNFVQQGEIQNNPSTYAVDSGSAANIYVGNYDPPIDSDDNALVVRLKVSHTNTGASTFNAGTGAYPIVRRDGSALIGNEMLNGQVVFLQQVTIASVIKWMLMTPAAASNTAALAGTDTQSFITPQQDLKNVQSATPNYAIDTGNAANVYVGTYAPIIVNSAGSLVVRLKVGHTNTGASTFDAGFGAQPIVRRDGSALIGLEMLAGSVVELYSVLGNWMLMTPSPATAAAALAGTDTQSFMTPRQVADAVAGDVELSVDFYNALQLGAWGDSLTYGYGGEDLGGPYTPYMYQMANWAPFRPFINEGISGQDSTQITTRFLAAPQYRTWRTIIWMGRNDIGSVGPNWAQTVLANFQACAAAMEAVGNTNYMFWGVTTNGLEYVGGPQEALYNQILAANALFASYLGDKFFDVRAYMASTAPFNDLGLTPDAQSLMEIARGEIPTFWRRDEQNVHFNNNGTNAQGYIAVQQMNAMDAAAPDRRMSAYSMFDLIGEGTTAQFNNVRIFNQLYMGDPIQGAGPVITQMPMKTIFMVGGGNQSIPSNIYGNGLTQEWNFFGRNAGGSTSIGRGNSGFGTDTLGSLTTGGFNTAVGTNALTLATETSSNVAVGYDSLASLVNQSTGNVAVGRYALMNSIAANPSTAVGFQSMFTNTTGQGTALGYQTLRNNTTGNNNVAVGYLALSSNVDGGSNTALGSSALANNISGVGNTAIGANALLLVTAGNNTAIGRSAGAQATTAAFNVFVGAVAGAGATTMQNSIAIGYQAMQLATSAHATIAIGQGALATLLTSTANVAVGHMALNQATGGNNVALGYMAASNQTLGTRNITIGYNIDPPNLGGSDQLTIANLIYGTNINGSGVVPSDGNLGVGGIPSGTGGPRLDVYGDMFRLRTAKTPASSSDSGNAGTWCWDTNYFYVCTASHTWKRAALSTW